MFKSSRQLITVPLYGGLANQLFQHVYGLSLVNHGFSVNFDTSLNKKNAHGLSVHVLNSFFDEEITHPKQVARAEIRFGYILWRAKHKLVSPHYDSTKAFHFRRVTYGYFQDFRHFEGLEDLQKKKYYQLFAVPRMLSPKVMLHIRLGDYQNATVQKVMTQVDANYYVKAINHFRRKYGISQFDVFSNDTAGALKVIDELGSRLQVNLRYQKSDDPMITMKKMAEYQYAIIPNSTYSWWATFLGNAKEICAPYPWFRYQHCSLYHKRIHRICVDDF